MRRLSAIVLTLLLPLAAHSQEGIGKWRDCLDHSAVYHVAPAADRIYAATHGGLFVYFPEADSSAVMSKANGLSDVGVATAAYDRESECLVVAYTNSNIDIVSEGRTYNLSDIKRSEIAGDKSVYHIRFHDGSAYLATGFGIVVVDLGRHEISETY